MQVGLENQLVICHYQTTKNPGSMTQTVWHLKITVRSGGPEPLPINYTFDGAAGYHQSRRTGSLRVVAVADGWTGAGLIEMPPMAQWSLLPREALSVT